MSSILNQFSGNKKDVLMFLVYSGESINETNLRAYAKFRKRTTNAVEYKIRSITTQFHG